MVNAISTAIPSEPKSCCRSILRFAVLDLVVLLIAPHPLQRFNGLDLYIPLETKCPNPVANRALQPGVQETHILQTFTSLLTSNDHRKYKLSTPALKVAKQHSAYVHLCQS